MFNMLLFGNYYTLLITRERIYMHKKSLINTKYFVVFTNNILKTQS